MVSVATCGAGVDPATVVKLSEAGVRVTCGAAAAVPVQVKAIESWGSGDGKFAPRFAERDPAAAGVQVIAMEQLAPAARLGPQLLLWVKELVLLPKNPKLLIDCGTPPVLLRVAVCAALVVPTVRLPKFIVAGVSTGCGPAAWPTPVPVKLMV